MNSQNKLFTSDKPVIGQRCVHLDLKGTPPTPERLIKLLKVFSAARYNSVLVEWEDSFPWTVDERFRSETAYSPAIIRKFVKTADDLGIEIIPLVQCLGHMETPLHLPEYAHLRERPYDESVLNPLAPGARSLIEKMVDDVLALMPGVKRFHLGGDEAWRHLRDRAWQRGIRLASDMVPNHMGIDSRWVIEHPEYFLQLGHPPYPAYRFTGGNLSEQPGVAIRIEDGYWDHRDAAVVFQRGQRP